VVEELEAKGKYIICMKPQKSCSSLQIKDKCQK